MTRAAAPWLLLALLCPALTSQADARHEAPATGPPAPPMTTPIRNLRLNPSQRRLTWELDDSDVITYGSRFLCQKGRGPPLRADPSGRSCSFPSLSHCHVTEFSAFPERYEDLAASVWFPEPHPTDHDHSMAARDLHCWVHDVDHMTCRWGRGQGATDDVRYRMFWRDARLGPDRDHECLHYDVTSDGSRVGCNLDLATIDPDPASLMTVTVNGSASALGVACNDEVVDLGRVEILAPPTLIAECNSSEVHVRWAARSRFHSGFQFTLQINKSSHQEPQNQMLFGTEFRIVNPGTTLSIRVRAHSVDGRKVSAWSPTQSLACDLQANPAMLMWLTLAGAGAGLTAMVATSLLLLWWRKPLLARLFPPIPRMRVQLEAHRDVVAWAPVPEDCEITHVTDA